jgi:asparagine synthase (glutamine-hydrolysing)
MSGMGGDELFGSYATFTGVPAMARQYATLGRHPWVGDALLRVRTWLRRGSTPTRPMLDGAARYGATVDGAYLLQRGWIPPWQLGQLIREDVARAGLERLAEMAPLTGDVGPEGLNDFGKVAYLEATRYMRNQLLRDSDWTGMAHSLEIRVPLVDVVLTERVIGLAATGRMRGGKAMLAEIVPGGLPPVIVNRPKTGFSIPIWVWLRQSAAAAAWKRNRFLARHNVGAYSRWAYCVLASRPETAEALR